MCTLYFSIWQPVKQTLGRGVVISFSDFFSGCQNQEIGRLFLLVGIIIGTSSYFGVDSAIEQITDQFCF
jgi:hypothetical protein